MHHAGRCASVFPTIVCSVVRWGVGCGVCGLSIASKLARDGNTRPSPSPFLFLATLSLYQRYADTRTETLKQFHMKTHDTMDEMRTDFAEHLHRLEESVYTSTLPQTINSIGGGTSNEGGTNGGGGRSTANTGAMDTGNGM